MIAVRTTILFKEQVFPLTFCKERETNRKKRVREGKKRQRERGKKSGIEIVTILVSSVQKLT